MDSIIRTGICLTTQVNHCFYKEASLIVQKQYHLLLLEIANELGYKIIFDDTYFSSNNFSGLSGLHIFSEKIIAFKEQNMFGVKHDNLEKDYEYNTLNEGLLHELTHALQRKHLQLMLPEKQRISTYAEYVEAIVKLLGDYSISPHRQSLTKGWEHWSECKHLYKSGPSFSWEIPAYYLENDLEAFVELFRTLEGFA